MADLLRAVWIHGRDATEGRFHCPSCDAETDARRTSVRRWLALLRWPILPVGEPRRLVACRTCGHVYDEAVALGPAGDPRERRAEDERAIDAVAAAAVYSDSAIRRSEKEAARRVIHRFGGEYVEGGELDGLLRHARRSPGDPMDRLEMLAHALDERAKRRILAAAYIVSAGDREVHPQETRFLMQVGEALRMRPPEVREALREADRG